MRTTLLLVLGLCALFQTLAAQPNTADPDFWVPNSTVRAIAEDATHYYIGGDFTYVGPNTGSGVPLDATTGIRSTVFPVVTGAVNAIVRDGAGGWYIGGNFTMVGGVPRNRLAHILADGSVDPVWDPNASGTVNALAVSGTTVYIGGAFTGANSINGTLTRNRLAAVDAVTGVATAWDPNANGAVNALAISGTTVYIGGAFNGANSINGTLTRNRLAAVDATTGIATGWNPNASGVVSALAISGTAVYIGGAFAGLNSINGTLTRNRVAAVDATTGIATAWNPNASGNVNALALLGTTVYLGGAFNGANSINGTLTRNRLAAVDATTGNATAWDPNANGVVNALVASGTTVYIAGSFFGANALNGTVTRNRLAAVDATTGIVTSWDPTAGGAATSLAISGTTVYAGGTFTSVNGYPRNRLAKISKTTGEADPVWDPNASSTVSAIAVLGTTVYFGGNFAGANAVNGTITRNRAAAVDATTGIVTAWDPNVSNNVTALLATGARVFIGGSFLGANSINGTLTRNCLAEVDATTGVATAWNPNIASNVQAMALLGNTLYLGGTFSGANSVNGTLTRNRLAAVDITTGIATAWDPNVNNAVQALAISGNTVFFGGLFFGANSVNGTLTRNRLAAVDATTGIATAWDPNVGNSSVNAIAVSNTTVYVGGGFNGVNSINGTLTRNRLAAIDIATGVATAWDPNASLTTQAILVSGSAVMAGGQFATIGGVNQPSLAYFESAIPYPVEWLSFTATASETQTAQLQWVTAAEHNSSHFVVEMAPPAQPFQDIGTVGAASNANGPTAYGFESGTLAPGTYQFRLRQTDLDGGYTHSPIAEVYIGDNTQPLTIYPNPLAGSVIQFQGDIPAQGTVTVFNSAGSPVYRHPMSPTMALPDHLPNGLYTVWVQTPDARTTLRVLLQR